MTSPRQRAPQRPAGETRQLLLAATRRLLATSPSSSITIRAIGEEAGLQFSLVTRHFGSKDALISAALIDVVGDWIAAMVDGPAESLFDRAVDYLVEHPFDVGAIRSINVEEDPFPDGRSPVVDAIVGHFRSEGRSVAEIDVTNALSLVLGWVSAEDHWVRSAGISVEAARTIVKAHAKRCLVGSDRA